MEASHFRMKDRLFLDTSYAVALSVIDDEYNSKALEIARNIESGNIPLITTQAILLEIGNSLSKKSLRQGAFLLLESIQNDQRIAIIPLSQDLYKNAFDLFRVRDDKEWGLVDCMSFVVMKENSITDALTADTHFKQAGFRALLRED